MFSRWSSSSVREWIDGRAAPVDAGTVGDAKRRRGDHQMAVGGRDIDSAGCQRDAVFGETRLERAGTVEHVGEPGRSL
jgi:hypothetical protein